MRRLSVILLLSALGLGPGAGKVYAETVSQKEASRVAQLFFNTLRGTETPKPVFVYNGKELTEQRLFSPFYVYNSPVGGYVIVSADNKAVPVLGYSAEGKFDSRDIEQGVKALLRTMSREIEWVRHDGRLPDEAIADWGDLRGYISGLIGARNALERVSLAESLGFERSPAESRTYREVAYGDKSLVLANSASEFALLPYVIGHEPVASLQPTEPDDTVAPEPFGFWAEIKSDMETERQKREDAMVRSVLAEPVLEHIGGGHYMVVSPEPLTGMTVYSLQGRVMDTVTYGYAPEEDRYTAAAWLDREPSGFYIVQVRTLSGAYAFKVHK